MGCVISSSGPGCPQTGLFYFLLNLSIMIFQNWQMGELRSYQIQTPWVPQKERVAQKEKRLTPIHTAQDHSVSLLAHSLGHHHPWAPPPPPPQDLNRYTGFHLLAKWDHFILFCFFKSPPMGGKNYIWLLQIFVVALGIFSCGIWDLAPRPVIEP